MATELYGFQSVRRAVTDVPAEVLALGVPPEEWRLMVSVRPNVLIEGTRESSEDLVRALAAVFSEPFCDWPDPVDNTTPATLIVRDVHRLSDEEQRRLLNRLDGVGGHAAPRQVISTSIVTVFALVERGQFLAELYYRLNSVRLPIGATGSEERPPTAANQA